MQSSYWSAAATLGWLCAVLMMAPAVAAAGDGSGDGDGKQPQGRVPAPSKSATRFSEVKVTARRPRLTAPDVAKQRERLDRIPGSVGFVDLRKQQDRYAATLREVLDSVPGVYVQKRYGQELRLSVRGSGIARGYHLRGIEILQDGIPFNQADGSGDFYEVDPLALVSAAVYRGGNGLTYGSSTLGGAINFVTANAFTATAPNQIRLDGGSFGTARLAVQGSRIAGPWDGLANVSIWHSDGYRSHEIGQYADVNGNLGYRLGPNLETRFYFGSYTVDQQLPGSLGLNDALNNPRLANPTALSGDQARDVRAQRVANQTTWRVAGGRIDFSTWVMHKSLFHPIFQVIDENGWTYGFGPRYSGRQQIAGHRNQLIVGFRTIGGDNVSRRFVNNAGSEGALTLDARQHAYDYETYIEDRFYLLPKLALMLGAKYLHDVRAYTDKGGVPGNPTPRSTQTAYDGFNPKLGLLWEPREHVQVFTDVTRSLDVPDFGDLAQTFGATARFVPLAPSRAWTLEVGSRGQLARLSWDVTLYRSSLRNELLQFVTAPDVPANTFNAPKTMHQGLEFGVGAPLVHGLLARGDRLDVHTLWNWSDFRYDNDPRYGDNRIAGIPQNLVRVSLDYRALAFGHGHWHLAPAVDWVPAGAWADQANTLGAPGYVVMGFEAGVDLPSGVSLFLDARNLNGERYVTDISTVADARTGTTQIFYPGMGRSVFGGVRYGFGGRS